MQFNDDRLPERFWSKVFNNPVCGCWEWTGGCSSTGYSAFYCSTRGGNRGGHRVAYETLVGPIPVGLQIDHLCRNKRCVNPLHLEPVTVSVNQIRGRAGEVASARHAAKTHCPKGHPYEGYNLYVNPRGARMCRTCARLKYWVGR